MNESERSRSALGANGSSVELSLRSRTKDLGEMTVRRVLPATQRKMVGPFIFFDHMGPAEFPPGQGISVRPHPHIGIATVTYLFEGEIIHRDSLGYVQTIHTGAVNLMAAGGGIVHSERAGDDFNTTSKLHGIQSWMALPSAQEEMQPEFLHYGAGCIPERTIDDVTVRIIMGAAYGETSPVRCYSPTLYLECRVPAGCRLTLPESQPELAAYVVSGGIDVDGHTYREGELLLARPGQAIRVYASQESHLMVLGGAPVGDRHIWWNFVSSSEQRIEQAKNQWRDGQFLPVPGDKEFIPLPD